ncbi:hypothetical protein BU17DRAFT_65999 [Hysterangium stoloniferum]|nr:hypothetical protein BU17DRAFT_65999 [Hysterangium stoloniferum]
MTSIGKRRTPESPIQQAQEVKRTSQGSKPLGLVETFSDSSATLNNDSVPVDKGKGVEPDPILIELQSLREQVAAQAKLLKAKEAALERIEREVSCSICMDMAPLPYILPACGHIYCHNCLAKWFTTPQEGEVVAEPQPHASDGDDSSNNKNNTNPTPEHGPPPILKPPPPIYHNIKNHIKMCPFCRAVVTDRPTPLRSFVNIATIIRGEEETAPPNYSKKNWKNIFRLKPSDKPAPGAPRAGSVYSDDSDFRAQLGAGALPPVFVDHEDGVSRCGRCFHELWNGQCSNDECQAEYDGHNDSEGDGNDGYADNHEIVWMNQADEGDFEDEEEDDLEGSFIYDGDDTQGRDSDDFISGPPRRLTREMGLPNVIIDNESDSESDDSRGFVRQHNRLHPIIIPSSSGEGSDDPSRDIRRVRIPAGGFRSARGHTSEFPIAVESSGEEEDDYPGPSQRHSRRRLILSDDDEESNDPGPSHRHCRTRFISDNEESDHPTTHDSSSRREQVSDVQEEVEFDVPRLPAIFTASNEEDENFIEEHNVEKSIGSIEDSSSILSIPDGIRARNIDGYISDSSYSYPRSHEEEEEFLGFGDYKTDLYDEQSDPGSDASAANPFEEGDDEEASTNF